MNSSSIFGSEPLLQAANVPGDDVVGRSRRVATHPARQHRLAVGLMLAAGVALLLAAGQAIASALGDPLLGVIGTGVLIATAAAFIAPMRRHAIGAR